MLDYFGETDLWRILEELPAEHSASVRTRLHEYFESDEAICDEWCRAACQLSLADTLYHEFSLPQEVAQEVVQEVIGAVERVNLRHGFNEHGDAYVYYLGYDDFSLEGLPDPLRGILCERFTSDCYYELSVENDWSECWKDIADQDGYKSGTAFLLWCRNNLEELDSDTTSELFHVAYSMDQINSRVRAIRAAAYERGELAVPDCTEVTEQAN